MHPTELREQIRHIVEPTVERLGFDLVAVEWVTGRGRPTLRLSIDKVGGIGADDCADLSVRVGPLLDEADPIANSYELEVSSPGIERPVQRLSDFRRFQGYRVRIRLEEGMPRRRYSGTIHAVEGDDVLIEVDGTVHTLSYESIESAHLALDLEAFNQLADGPPPLPEEQASESAEEGS